MSTEQHRRIAYLAPGALGEIEMSAFNGMRHQNLEVRTYNSASQISRDETVFVYGPMYSHGKAITGLDSKNPVRVWYTEQLPHLPVPAFVQAKIAALRVIAERASGKSNLPGGRLRALGEALKLSQSCDFALSTYSESNAGYFQSYGIDARAVNPGYFPELGRDFGIPLCKRKIDAIFMGSTKGNRREKLILDLKRELGLRDINLKIIDNGNVGENAIFGTERTKVLNDTKIMVCLARDPDDDPIFRFELAGANGNAAITEKARPSMTNPFQRDVHFKMEEVGHMADAIQAMLSNLDATQVVATSLHTTVIKTETSKQIMSVLD